MDPHDPRFTEAPNPTRPALHDLMAAGDQPRLDNYDWRRIFTEQMQYRGATGSQIGDAWALVEAHCAESGERAEQGFGDPTDYADQLAGPPRLWRGFRDSMLPTVLAGFGLSMLLCLPWTATGQPMPVSWGTLVRFAAFALFGLAATALYIRARGRTGLRVAGFMALMFCWQMAMTALGSWGTAAFTAPAWSLWLLAAVVSVIASWALVRQVRNHVVDPRGIVEPTTNWWWSVAPFIFPLVAAGILAVRALAH